MCGDPAVFERCFQVVEGDDAEPGERGSLLRIDAAKLDEPLEQPGNGIRGDVGQFRFVEHDVAELPVK